MLEGMAWVWVEVNHANVDNCTVYFTGAGSYSASPSSHYMNNQSLVFDADDSSYGGGGNRYHSLLLSTSPGRDGYGRDGGGPVENAYAGVGGGGFALHDHFHDPHVLPVLGVVDYRNLQD